VFAGGGAVVFADEGVDAVGEFVDDGDEVGTGEIHERDDVEIAVADVAGDRVDEVVVVEDVVEAGEEGG